MDLTKIVTCLGLIAVIVLIALSLNKLDKNSESYKLSQNGTNPPPSLPSTCALYDKLNQCGYKWWIPPGLPPSAPCYPSEKTDVGILPCNDCFWHYVRSNWNDANVKKVVAMSCDEVAQLVHAIFAQQHCPGCK